MEGLTLKQAKFVAEYIKNGGNGTRAALDTYDTEHYGTAHQLASTTLQKPAVRSHIEKVRALLQRRAMRHVRNIDVLAFDAKSEYVRLEASKDMLDRAGVVKPAALAIDNRSLVIHISGESATRYSLPSTSTIPTIHGVVTQQDGSSGNLDKTTDRGVPQGGDFSGTAVLPNTDITAGSKKVPLTKQEDSGEDWEL